VKASPAKPAEGEIGLLLEQAVSQFEGEGLKEREAMARSFFEA